MRLFLHLARRALLAFLAALAAVVALFLAVDFAENASLFRGPGWLWLAALIYANRAALVAWQTAPAAMLLSAALTASALRKTREYTALRALGLGPWRVALPVAAVALLAAAAMAWLGDAVAAEAGARADALQAEHFGGGTPTPTRDGPRGWFRGRDGRRIYHLRHAAEDGAFERVTVLELTPDFRLSRRIDADRMLPGGGPGEWLLVEGTERRFSAEGLATESFPARGYAFGEQADAFAIRPGRPAEMRAGVLVRQIGLRRALGLPVAEYLLAWHNRWSWPLGGLPTGLLALGLALRRDRRGHFTAALVESVAVSLAFWVIHGVFASLALSGRLPAGLAAWAAGALFLGAGALALRRYA